MVHKNTWLVLRKESQDMRASQHVCYVNETLWSTESKETRSRTARVHMSIHASILNVRLKNCYGNVNIVYLRLVCTV